MTSVLAPGRTFGRYVVERPLGTGGMGEVVVAMDTFLHRRVALKIVRRDRASNVLVARLMSEARAAAALHHPNIVTLLDAGDIFFEITYPDASSAAELMRLPVASRS